MNIDVNKCEHYDCGLCDCLEETRGLLEYVVCTEHEDCFFKQREQFKQRIREVLEAGQKKSEYYDDGVFTELVDEIMKIVEEVDKCLK